MDWSTTPVYEDLVEDFITGVRTRDEHNATQDYTGDTNLPSGTLRYNRTSEHYEEYDGSNWNTLPFHELLEDHIANVALHSGVPTGGIIMYGGTITANGGASPPPATWYWCNHDAVSRTTDAALFTVIGTTFGAGDGTTTFNLPDFQQRIPIGKAASGTGATLGGTFGSIDHTHTGGAHTHTVASHTHSYAHTHTTPTHSHTLSTHTHVVPGHYHAATGNGADIAISTASGSHQHNVVANPDGTSGTANRVQQSNTTNSNNVTTSNDTLSNHTHPNSAFAGRVGNVTGGVSGDSNITSGNNTSITVSGGNTTTDSQSTSTTGGTSLTTDSGGAVSTGGSNPPCLVVNFIIKR